MERSYREMLERTAREGVYIDLSGAEDYHIADAELADEWRAVLTATFRQVADPDTAHEGGNVIHWSRGHIEVEPREMWVKLGDRDGAICPGPVVVMAREPEHGEMAKVQLSVRWYGTPDGGETIWALYEAEVQQ